jgi:polyphosphate glucokinase
VPRNDPVVATAMKILTLDIGGSHIKALAIGQPERRKIESGRRLTPDDMVRLVMEATKDWEFEAVSIGYPGLVGQYGPLQETQSLGNGWVGFDYAAAFGRPVKIINDAAMQALGSYEGGRMLFLGLGTGLGSAFIAGKVVMTLELGRLHYSKRTTLDQYFGRAGLKQLGPKRWERSILRIVPILKEAFVADYVVLGGGNSKTLTRLPPDVQRGGNEKAFVGGFRLWGVDAVATHAPDGTSDAPATPESWQVL